MAATVAILDHMMPKITRCAILKPLKLSTLKPKAKQILKLHIFPIQDGRRSAIFDRNISIFDWCRDLDLANVHNKYEDNP